METSQKMLALSREGKKDEARAIMDGVLEKMFLEFAGKVDQLVRVNLDASVTAGKVAEETYSNARNWIVGVLVAAIELGALMALALARVVSRPLLKAVGIAQAVSAGDLSTHIEVRSKDETGQLVQALKDMNNGLGTHVR
jgi:methyl-accepting chemotaxis protein